MEKIRELVKGKKMVVVITTIVIIVVVSVIGVYALLQNKTVLEVKEKKVTYEYGNKVEINAKDLLKTTDKEILNIVKIKNTIVNVEGKEYPKLGTYTITLSYQKEKAVVDVEVKDTVAPTFNDCNSVEFIKGTDFNYSEYINATDLQEVSYEFKKDTVDVNTVGEYKMQVIATDKSNNKANKDIKVRVLDTVDTTTNEVTTTVDEKGNVKTTVTEKPKVDTPSTPNTSTSNGSSSSGTTPKPTTPKPTTPNKPTEPSKPNVCPPGYSLNANGDCSKEYTYEDESNNPNHQHYASFISPLFDTVAEYQAWGNAYLDSDENFYSSDKKSGYGGSRCSCGKYGVTHFY